MLKRWVIWLIVLVVIVALGQGLAAAMVAQIPRSGDQAALQRAVSMHNAANITLWISWAAAYVWLIVGCWWWRHLKQVRWTAFFLHGTVVLYLITGSRIYVGPPYLHGMPSMSYYLSEWGLSRWYPGTAIGLSGIWAMTIFFLLGLALIRLLLRPGHPVLGIARTLVDEAIRMKVALIFIILIVVVLPILPFLFNPAERLQYRVQSFITYSLGLGTLFLSLMTIFLACKTISDELERRQIFLTLTKPVGRGQYLLGKWLGIMALNLLLVAAIGGATHLFTRILQAQRDRGDADRWAVEEYVLVARDSVQPVPIDESAMQNMFRNVFKEMYEAEPERFGGGNYNPANPQDLQAAANQLTPEQRKQIQTVVLNKWFTIAPRNKQTYRFTGLNAAKAFGRPIQLRFKINSNKVETSDPTQTAAMPDNETVTFGLKLNGHYFPDIGDTQAPVVVTPNNFRVIDVPLSYINDDGVLDMEIYNIDLLHPDLSPPVSLTFDSSEGLEVLYRVSSYEANLFRALAIIWVQLGFLAIFGLAAGTFLGFNVAALLSLMVYVVSIAKSFIIESIGYFAAPAPAGSNLWQKLVFNATGFGSNIAQGKIWDALKIPIGLLGDSFTMVVPSFSDFDPVPKLADGRLISWLMVSETFLWVGVISAGFCGLLGWWIFSRRELARVTV